MKTLIHEETQANGLTFRVETTETSMRVTALRGGKPLSTASHWHAGLQGPGSWRPEESGLAKSLKQQVEDEVFGRVRRSEFDMLVREMWTAWNTKMVTGSVKPTLFVRDPKRKPSKQTGKRALFFGIGKR